MIEIRKGVYLFIHKGEEYPIVLIALPRGYTNILNNYAKMSDIGSVVKIKQGLDYYKIAIDLECANYFGVLEHKDPIFEKAREDYKYLTGKEWEFKAFIKR